MVLDTSARAADGEIEALNSNVMSGELDRVLARHDAFTDEELDFIINYDIEYGMGREALEGGEGAEEEAA